MTRTRRIAWLLVIPPLAGVAIVLGFLGAEFLGFRPLAGDPANIAEAAATGYPWRALQFIDKGEDPNADWPIAEDVIDSHAYRVNAIDAAILGRRPEMIPLLRQHGATIVNLAQSTCLAQAVNLPEALPLVGAPSGNRPVKMFADSSDAILACLGLDAHR